MFHFLIRPCVPRLTALQFIGFPFICSRPLVRRSARLVNSASLTSAPVFRFRIVIGSSEVRTRESVSGEMITPNQFVTCNQGMGRGRPRLNRRRRDWRLTTWRPASAPGFVLHIAPSRAIDDFLPCILGPIEAGHDAGARKIGPGQDRRLGALVSMPHCPHRALDAGTVRWLE